MQEHHCFGAGNRKLSTKYGLTIPLCMDCHTGNKGVHNNYQLNLYVKRIAQVKFEKKYGREKFMEVFMKKLVIGGLHGVNRNKSKHLTKYTN